MSIYSIAKANGWLKSDVETLNLLKEKEYKLLNRFKRDENLLIYIPYIPLQIFEPLNKIK